MQMLLEALIPIIAILSIFSIPLLAIFTSYKLKMEKLKQEEMSVDDEAVRELRQQMGQLIAENELLKEAVIDIQRSLGQTSTRIELSEYEKQQIKIDQENKNFY